MVPFVQNFSIQETLVGHALDKLLFIVHCIGRVFSILDISLNTMVPGLFVGFDFDTQAFFNVHTIG